MIFMSKYKGKHGGKRVKKFGQGSPPPFSGNGRKKFFSGLLPFERMVMMIVGWELQSNSVGIRRSAHH